jgi:hypothetical protein
MTLKKFASHLNFLAKELEGYSKREDLLPKDKIQLSLVTCRWVGDQLNTYKFPRDEDIRKDFEKEYKPHVLKAKQHKDIRTVNDGLLMSVNFLKRLRARLLETQES